MKILKPSAYYEPEVFSSAHLNNDLEKALVENGDEIYIVTPQPSRGCTEEDYIKYKPREQKYDGHVNIERFKLMKEGKNVLKRAFRYVYMNFKQYLICSKYKDIDLIYAASTPPTQGFLATLLKKRLNKPFVYNLQDVFPDSMVNAKITKKGSLIWNVGRIIEDFTYRNADKIIVISEDFKKNIMEKGVPENKIVVISNWVDTNAIYPIEKMNNKLYDEFNIPNDKYIVLYAGNLGNAQGSDVILEAADLLSEYNDILFVVFGGGSQFEEFKLKAKSRANLLIFDLLPSERVPEVYSLGDIALITCKKGTGMAGMPSKTWSIMACNVPIIASFDIDSELARILEQADAGICVEPENAEHLSKVILNQYINKNNIKCNARDYVVNNISKNYCTDMYVREFLNTIRMEER